MAIGETSGIEKTLIAGEAITKYQLVALGDDDDSVKLAVDPTKPLIGVSMNDAPKGGKVNVMLTGVAEVELGGAVTRGDLLTADGTNSVSQAVTTSTAKNYVVGIAVRSGVDGDIIPVLLSQGII